MTPDLINCCARCSLSKHGRRGAGNGRHRSLVILAATSLLAGCGTTGKHLLLGTAALGTAGTLFGKFSANTARIQRPKDPVYPSRAFVTEEIFKSMIYLARTDSGVIVIDLGWNGADDLLLQNLGKLRFRVDPSDPATLKRATVHDIFGVFLTHSHYDHIQGWRSVSQRRGRFRWHADSSYRRNIYLAKPERSYLLGKAEFSGPVPKVTEHLVAALTHVSVQTDWGTLRLLRPRRPREGQVKTKPFAGDTSFALGRDTLYALTVPGHTQGSAAYIFRNVMFAGDALTTGTPLFLFPMPSWAPWDWGRMRRGSWAYADNVRQNRKSVSELRKKVERLPYHARPGIGCIAHAICQRMAKPREWERFWEVAIDRERK